jgi:hypothetical protein
MTDDIPDRAARAFEGHDAFERDGDRFVVTTTRFGGRVAVAATDDWDLAYTLTVRAPMLRTAVDGDEVGDAVESGWFETYERRLADAPTATRQDVELGELTVTDEDGEAVAEFTFEFGNADRAPAVVTAIAEYVEGTYVEGIVPGYEYTGEVADLLGEAASGSDGQRGGTPL